MNFDRKLENCIIGSGYDKTGFSENRDSDADHGGAAVFDDPGVELEFKLVGCGLWIDSTFLYSAVFVQSCPGKYDDLETALSKNLASVMFRFVTGDLSCIILVLVYRQFCVCLFDRTLNATTVWE